MRRVNGRSEQEQPETRGGRSIRGARRDEARRRSSTIVHETSTRRQEHDRTSAACVTAPGTARARARGGARSPGASPRARARGARPARGAHSAAPPPPRTSARPPGGPSDPIPPSTRASPPRFFSPIDSQSYPQVVWLFLRCSMWNHAAASTASGDGARQRGGGDCGGAAAGTRTRPVGVAMPRGATCCLPRV